MQPIYSHLSLVTLPNTGAHETLGFSRSLLERADAKPLPKRFRVVVENLRVTFTALEQKLQRRTRRAGAQAAGGRDDIDVQADRLVAVLHGVVTTFARLPDDVDTARGTAARALASALFPESLAVIVQAKYAEQYERTRELLVEAGRKANAAHLATLGLGETVAALRALMPRYRALADAVATSSSDDFEYVRDELLALREAIANYARLVDGDAASGVRNNQLRARRLLKPLRALGEKTAQQRSATKSANEKARDEKKSGDDSAKGAKGNEDSKGAEADAKKPAVDAGTSVSTKKG